MKLLVVGLGNPILGDDGVGWCIIDALEQHKADFPDVELDRLALGGISLMERLIGYDQVILVDAIVTGEYPIGEVRCFNLKEMPNRALGHLSSGHDTTLQTALQVGKAIGARLPENIIVVGVEARNVIDFSEELTPAVEAAIPQAVSIIMNTIWQTKEA